MKWCDCQSQQQQLPQEAVKPSFYRLFEIHNRTFPYKRNSMQPFHFSVLCLRTINGLVNAFLCILCMFSILQTTGQAGSADRRRHEAPNLLDEVPHLKITFSQRLSSYMYVCMSVYVKFQTPLFPIQLSNYSYQSIKI